MTREEIERDLDRAAAILQAALAIGAVKHIGHREVADGVQRLVDAIRSGDLSELRIGPDYGTLCPHCNRRCVVLAEESDEMNNAGDTAGRA